MSSLPACKYQHQAGSYYNLLPWCECHKDPPDHATMMTNEWPMCKYDAGQICDYYENLCKSNKE